DLMIQPRMVQDMHLRMYRASLRVLCAVYEPAYASMHQRARAHRARLNRGKQLAIADTIIPNYLSGFTECDYLGMGGGIRIHNVAIKSSANYPSITNNDSSHWHFACLKCPLSGTQSLLHKKFI